MSELRLDIIEFIRHPEILNDQCHSEHQVACLKSIYGFPLNPVQRSIYQECTGRVYEEGQEQREVTVIAGRRSGKTGEIAAPIVCFEAFRSHGLKPGEEGFVMLLAPTLAQARIAFRYVRNYLRRSPILSKRIVNTTKNEIKLDNGITIGCYASTYDGVRGRTIVTVVCDELAFWPREESAADSDEEVIAALRPGIATIRNAKLIKISTPYAKCGVLWLDFKHRTELDFPVWQVSSIRMNPTIDVKMLEREKRRNEENYRREYLAEFTDSINSWIIPEILDPCVVRGCTEVPPRRDARYAAAIDPATRHSDFALAILEFSPEEKVVLARLVRWRGTRKAPLACDRVLGEIKSILDGFEINCVTGDQYYCDVIGQNLLKLGISYEVSVFGPQTRSKIFANLKHLLVQRKIELLDDPELLSELRSLQEVKTERGQIDVRPGLGMRDDSAVVVAVAASELMKQAPCQPGLQLGIVDRDVRSSLRMIPGSCPYEAVCGNFPQCMDAGHCLDFDDQRSLAFAHEISVNRKFPSSPNLGEL
jgi:hypothetical protein